MKCRMETRGRLELWSNGLRSVIRSPAVSARRGVRKFTLSLRPGDRIPGGAQPRSETARDVLEGKVLRPAACAGG